MPIFFAADADCNFDCKTWTSLDGFDKTKRDLISTLRIKSYFVLR